MTHLLKYVKLSVLLIINYLYMRLTLIPAIALSSVLVMTACSKKSATEDAKNALLASDEIAKSSLPSVQSLSTKGFVPDRIFYKFDDSSVEGPYKESLKLQVAYLKAKLLAEKNLEIVVEGNCDEKGGVDYNMALGQKRANAVKEFFVSEGIPAEQIKTVSFGKERKLVEGTSAVAYLQNRAAITKVNSK